MLNNAKHKSCLTLIFVTQNPNINQNSIAVAYNKRPITICSVDTVNTMIPNQISARDNNCCGYNGTKDEQSIGEQMNVSNHYQRNNSLCDSFSSNDGIAPLLLNKFITRTQSEDSSQKYCCKLEVKFVWYGRDEPF